MDENMEVVKCEKGLEARGEEVLEGQERGLPLLFSLLWVLSNISSSLSVLITATFWAALYDPQLDELDFNNFSGHLFLAVIHIVDLFVSDR